MGRIEGRFRLGALILIGLLQACASGPPPTATELGEAALARGDWAQARIHFHGALADDPGQGRAWLGQAQAEVEGRDPEAALRSLSGLARVDRARFEQDAPEIYADTLEAVTRQRLARGQAEPAFAAAQALARADPERRGLGALLGRAIVAEADRHRLLGEREKALELFGEACTVAPELLEAWISTAELMIETGRGREAVRLLEQARRFHPSSGELQTLSVQALRAR